MDGARAFVLSFYGGISCGYYLNEQENPVGVGNVKKDIGYLNREWPRWPLTIREETDALTLSPLNESERYEFQTDSEISTFSVLF